jgi:four helix bundle protein
MLCAGMHRICFHSNSDFGGLISQTNQNLNLKKMANLPYKKLRIWSDSMLLTEKIYTITKNLPKEEIYGLTNQMRRCSVSIASNIAEGYMRGRPKEIINFLLIALGSSAELETQLEICRRLNFVSNEGTLELLADISSIQKQMYSFIKAVEVRNGII